MKKTDCTVCNTKGIPVNDTVKIDGKVCCNNCLKTHYAEHGKLENHTVEKVPDPTVCASCHKDFGETELTKISVYPICPECETTIKNKTLPAWVKGFFVAILVIVIGSLFWNWKFYSAYLDIRDANQHFKNGDYANAALLMEAASVAVPEVEDIKTISSYFKGIKLLSEDNSSGALTEFEKCRDKLPQDYNLNNLLLQAKIGSTFDNKDYNGFLQATKENLVLDSLQATSLASVASAHACLYAQSGKEEDKLQALNYLSKARQIDSVSKEVKEYYNMIEYRLHSRKIIRRKEFQKQFPNGWNN